MIFFKGTKEITIFAGYFCFSSPELKKQFVKISMLLLSQQFIRISMLLPSQLAETYLPTAQGRHEEID